jgi:HEAT repeat protein
MLEDLEADKLLRRRAVLAIYHMGAKAKSAVPRLTELSQMDNSEIRHAALAALTGIGPAAEEAVPTLIQLLEHDDFHSQYWSCRVLAAIGMPAAEPAVGPLLECLDTGVASVRRNAAAALGELGPKVAARVCLAH